MPNGVKVLESRSALAQDRILMILEAAVVLLVTSVVLYSPIYFGSVKPDSLFLLESAAAVLALVWSFYLIAGGNVTRTGVEIAILSFLAVLILQVIPLPQAVVEFLSPKSFEVYKSSRNVTSTGGTFTTFSVDSFQTLARLVEYTSYFLLFFVSVNVIRRKASVWWLCAILILIASSEAAFGLWSAWRKDATFLGYTKPDHVDVASGTFVNTNHFASYVVMFLPLILAAAASAYSRTDKKRFVLLAFGFSCVIIVFLAVVYSRSRAGIALAVLSVFLFFLLIQIRNRGVKGKVFWLATFAAIGLSIQAIGFRGVFKKFSDLPADIADPTGRSQVWQDTFQIFLDYPLLGSGAGTYSQVFPKYQSVYHSFYSHAHNDFLQILSETGVVAIVLFAAILWLSLRRLLRILKQDQPDSLQTLQIGAFCSLVVALGMSLIHFSFQIPAIAATTAVIAAIFFMEPAAPVKERYADGN